MLGWARVRTTSGRVYATTTRLTTSRGRLAVPARFRTRGNGPLAVCRSRCSHPPAPHARERPGRAAAAARAARDDGPQGLPGARTVLLLLR